MQHHEGSSQSGIQQNILTGNTNTFEVSALYYNLYLFLK